MKPSNARELPLTADLSLSAMIEMVKILPGTKLYEIRVSEAGFQDAKDLVAARIIEQRRLNPSTPWINITFEPGYEHFEWSLHSGDECVWSQGC